MTTPDQPDASPPGGDAAAVAALSHDYRRMRDEIAKVIIGQEIVVEDLLTGLFARGHVLARRRARAGQDPAGQHRRADPAACRSAASSSRPT